MSKNRKRALCWAGLGLLIFGALFWFYLQSLSTTRPVPEATDKVQEVGQTASSESIQAPGPPPAPIRPDGRPQGSPLGEQLHHPDRSPADDLVIVHRLLQTLRLATAQQGHRPMSYNEEFTAALTGKNSLGLPFLRPTHRAVNEEGQLIDRWGTPLHFHPLGRDSIELRSAGPDGSLFTDDDLLHGEDPERAIRLD